MLTKDMVDKILDAAERSDDEDYLFLLLLARTGRRLGEVLGITPRDIDYAEHILWTDIEKTYVFSFLIRSTNLTRIHFDQKN